jgi:hypothetical protein
MSDIKDIPSRRRLLAGATAALAAGALIATGARAAPVASPATSGDDDELIRLRACQDEAWALAVAIMDEGEKLPLGITPQSKDQEQRLSDAENQYLHLIEQIAETPATTPAGLRAKAQVMQSFLERVVLDDVGASSLDDIASRDAGQTEHRMVLSIVRDVLAGRAAA